MGKPFKPGLLARIRAAWAVLRAERSIVILYDPRKPANHLGDIHTGMSMPHELPERLAAACWVAVEYNKIDDREGQRSALTLAQEIIAKS